MKELIIKNVADIQAKKMGDETNVFYSKPVVAGEDIDTCTAAFIEVPVGNHAFGYHYHDQIEEIFYIVSGVGTLRCPEGEKAVKAGDMLCFPTGEKGAHVLSNASNSETLVFIDFGVRLGGAEVVTFPDTKKLWIIADHVNGMVDMPEQK